MTVTQIPKIAPITNQLKIKNNDRINIISSRELRVTKNGAFPTLRISPVMIDIDMVLFAVHHLHVAPNFRSTFLWEILISEVELIGGMKHLFIRKHLAGVRSE